MLGRMRKMARPRKRPSGARNRPECAALESRTLLASGFRTTGPAYLVPRAGGVEITPLLTVGDAVDDRSTPGLDSDYRMVGIPDGLGAYDNGDGTFTVLMNHELGATAGVVRDHGSAGSFVSKWVIDKSTLGVLGGQDLIKSVVLFDPATGKYVNATTAFVRLCSADLPDLTAFFNPETGLGTDRRIFMNGEESTGGRAFGTVVDAGIAYELPHLGKFAWENSVASPLAQDKTIVMGLDNSSRLFSTEGATDPSEVYVYVGAKKRGTGNPISDAGLTEGLLHGVRVGLPGGYDANEATVTSGERFGLVSLGDVSRKTSSELQSASIANTVTQFRRVEDGAWDPSNPDHFYFVTTDQFGGTTRLWRLRFDDVTNPEAGGVIEIAYDSPAGVAGEMFDNITIDPDGHILIQEDPGGQPYLAKVWQYEIATGDLTLVAEHNPDLFTPGAPNFLTFDEESSGIIDVSHILGPGYYLADVQAHYSLPGELVQGGQFWVLNTNATKASLADGTLTVQGSINDDTIVLTRRGQDVAVVINGSEAGTFDRRVVNRLRIDGSAGGDTIRIGRGIAGTIVTAGPGNDSIFNGGSRSMLIGGEGNDLLIGGPDGDILIGGTTAHDDDDVALGQILDIWERGWSRRRRVQALESLLSEETVIDDDAVDFLSGLASSDTFFFGDESDWEIGRDRFGRGGRSRRMSNR